MYRFTVVKEDKVVHIDNKAVHNMDLSSIPDNVHAIQWRNGSGHIEYNDKPEQDIFTSLEPYADIIAQAEQKIYLELNPPPLEPTKENLIIAASTKRKIINTGSALLTVNSRNIPVWVDDISRASLTQMVAVADLNPEFVADWKGADGNFYTLNAQEIKDLLLAVTDFVETAFQCERYLTDQINNNTVTTFAEIEAYPSWPVNWSQTTIP